ncbi:hypothetical protein EV182_003261 [Spiromyces aspiralis]|uniref:Uncharacterized protein n=1 Tax=Spiromyces aspiralis TaxID=68401 RepID=A0ACC1HY75_9FUNG|nr:hypothetical protein EV182_003261 [Spiromyces aspiralis]
MLRIARGYAELRLLEAEVKEAGDGKGAKQAQKRRGERERRRWHRKVEQERQKRADQVNYQTSILMLWFCNIPFCAPELMVWMKNLSVSWHHDNASDHYATKVVGFYLLYMICSNEMLPRLTWERARKGGEWYGVARVWGNAVQYGRLIVGAWLVGFALIYGMRQPYLLHGAIHWISLWLIVIHVGHKLVVCSS